MKREELIKELNKIWDVENMLKEFNEPLPEFCKTYLQAIQEQADFIIADRARLLAEIEEALKPLREYKMPAMLPNGYLYNAHKVMAETLSALDKMKEVE